MHHQIQAPPEVCTMLIDFDIEDGILHNVTFTGGCPGNLAAIGKLVEGMKAEEVGKLLAGNRCGQRPTSCADQLARAILGAVAAGT